jgi:hypothetical protein
MVGGDGRWRVYVPSSVLRHITRLTPSEQKRVQAKLRVYSSKEPARAAPRPATRRLPRTRQPRSGCGELVRPPL